jgi:diguanylate cyclase (GGDEF)-like protein
MGKGEDRRSIDGTDLHVRLASVPAGVRVTFVVCAAAAADVAFYAAPSHRGPLALVLMVAVIGAAATSLLPWERIVRGRWREWVFLAWSLSNVATIEVFSLVDGQPNSAMSLMFFVPMVFVSTTYPLRSVIAVSGATVCAFFAAALHAGSSPDFMLMFAAVLACTALMGAWQARNHDRVREELARVSRTDPLTSCLNRRGFEARAEAAIESGAPIAVVLVDLDGFKQVNDTRGHAAGDALLRDVADRLAATVGSGDAVGRLGGDEFALLLHDVESHRAAEAADSVRAALAEVARASVGVAAAAPGDGTALDALIKRADWNLYESKSIRRASLVAMPVGPTAVRGPVA